MHHHVPSPRRVLTRTTGVGIALLVAVVGLRSPASPSTSSASSLPTTPVLAASVSNIDGFTAGDAATASVDLSGVWSFTPSGQATTSITVPGGGWYKQGFTNVGEAVYSRSVTVPNTGQPQSAWIEFGAVNHQATLSVDGRVVATQTTAFTSSKCDITP
ncbi:MAG: beta-galactosidase, partial [Catenulispora sp.]